MKIKHSINHILRYIFLFLITLASPALLAQNFGNEWIDYSKTYYKIPISKEGIYRITYSQLQAAGFPVATTDPHQIQLFFRGKEVAIRVVGEADSVFNQGDYIEFYGRSNRFDQLVDMFDKPTNIPRIFDETYPFYVYYTDFSAYFLTTTNFRERGKRIQTYTERSQNINPEVFHTQFISADNQTGIGYSYGPLSPITFNGSDEKGALFSHFTEGVGNVGRNYAPAAKVNLPLGLVDVKIGEARAAGRQPSLSLKIVGKTNTPHNVEIFADILPDSQKVALANPIFENRGMVTLELPLDKARFPANNGNFFFSFKVNGASAQLLTFGAIQLAYPQGFDMQGAGRRRFLLNPNPTGKSKIQLANAAANTRIFDITDEYGVTQIGTENIGSTQIGIINNSNVAKTLLATNTTTDIATISRVNFFNIGNPSLYDYLIVTDERLTTPINGINAVQAYADYRASTKGGKRKPLVITFQQLCDLFTYGETLPLSMRRFTNYMTRNTNETKFLFLVGKGLQLGYYEFYELYYNRVNALARPYQNMVPPWGNPASDNEISAGQNGFPSYIPSIPTGRISAGSPAQVLDYLNKVKEYEEESTEPAWKKEVLHLSGGFQLSENIAFKSYMAGFARLAQADFWGANVETLSKRTTDYVEYINITQQINAGKGLVTFFGHSSLEYIDIDVGRVSEPRLGFRNKGKYPMMIVNGCGSGDAFQRATSLGEDWTLTPDKGAIAFMAHSHIGLDGPLRAYTQTLYEKWFTEKGMINKPIGIVIQEFLKTYLSRFNDGTAIANAQQFTLQGDPALVLFKSTLPDYSITDNDLFLRAIGNRSLTAQSDSFRIGIPVKNLGITDDKRFQVNVKRTYPDGTTETLPAIRHSRKVLYLDTVYYTIVNSKTDRDRINGNNSFEVSIDPNYEIAETRKNNNIATLNFFFRKGSMLTIAPKEFSIVSKQPVAFIAQNTDAFTKERLYRFQLDTAHTFNSPILRDTVVYGYVTPFWTTSLLADNQVHDSTVYYWRTRYAELTPDDDPAWADASFIYIKNSPDGWSQSKIPQFQKDNFERVSPNLQRRKWEFTDNILNIQASTTGSSNPNWASWNLVINGQTIATSASCAVQQSSRICGSTIDRFILLSIDGETGRPYREFASESFDACGSNLLVTGIEQCLWVRDANVLRNYLSKVKTGDYVVIMNSRFAGNIGGSIDAFAQIGVDKKNLENRGVSGTAFIIVGRKGAAVGTAFEKYGVDANQEINLTTTIRTPSRSGQITSTLIGPAAEWGKVLRLVNNAENPTRESWKLDVVGVGFNGAEQLVKENVRQDGLSLADINPSLYPYVKLRLNVADSVNRTPYQLQRWQVIYKEVPEGILLYDTLTYRENTVLEIVEGDSIKVGFNFINISGNDFREPQLTVEYDILNVPTGKRTKITENIPAPKRNQTTYFKTKFYSLDFVGENRMTVFVNPRIQAEQIYENNRLDVRFKVKEDDINPVLDVAVDGRHIMDGEIVSPTPTISIGLSDENKYLIRKDTTGMEIFITRDCPTCKPQRIYMNNPNLVWTIVAEKNKLQIDYKSEKLENGIYKLSVQGRDSRNNQAGAQPFSVTFKVINETKISNFYPYPNPFTTNMKFVFTLTGEVPNDIRIQIMTITGKVIRTIHKDELGALRVGDNISEFSWDGTDQFGDQLARGVYLFKVDVRTQGKDFERFETAGDGLFEKGYGKIYLMR